MSLLTVPDGTAKDELNAMLQSLLEDRFGLKVHRATKTGQGFALVVGKDGPVLETRSAAAAPSDPNLSEEERKAQLQQKMLADMAASRKRSQDDFASGKVVVPFNSESWRSITTEELAAQLVRFAEAPVVDETGLTGEYSVTIRTSAKMPTFAGGTHLRCGGNARPEAGAAQGDRRYGGGGAGVQNAHRELGEDARPPKFLRHA